MALTKIKTDGVTDDAITTDKLADAINTARAANTAKTGLGANAVQTSHIADDAVTADKLANSINTEITANTAKTTNATHTGEVTGSTALTIADDVVDEANLKVSNTPTNGQFLSAQSGNTGGLTWATVDLTALSASNLTSGTVPDARFPATLPAASAANLTSIPAANITGTLPAISGANLTNLPAGGKITRVLVATNSGTTSTNSTSYVEHVKLTVTNVTSNARYVVYFWYELGSQSGNNYGAHNHIPSYAYSQIQNTGVTLTGGVGSYVTQRNVITDYYIVPVSFVKYDEASNTTDRTYSIEVKSSTTTSGHAGIAKYGTIVALEYTV